LVNHIHPPYLCATYHGVNELSTPYFEVFFFGDVGIWKRFEEIQNGSLGLVKERWHFCGDGV
jgi:hypothetical protein